MSLTFPRDIKARLVSRKEADSLYRLKLSLRFIPLSEVCCIPESPWSIAHRRNRYLKHQQEQNSTGPNNVEIVRCVKSSLPFIHVDKWIKVRRRVPCMCTEHDFPAFSRDPLI